MDEQNHQWAQLSQNDTLEKVAQPLLEKQCKADQARFDRVGITIDTSSVLCQAFLGEVSERHLNVSGPDEVDILQFMLGQNK